MKKKKIKVYYADIQNMGDQLNKVLIEKIYNCKVVRKNFLLADVSGIGSGLSNFFYENIFLRDLAKKIFGLFKPRVYIWGTGFISYNSGDKKLCKKKTKFMAVRGELSKSRIEKSLNTKIDCVTGDAGILASYLIDEKIEKKYDIGIIPHLNEQNDKRFAELIKQFSNSRMIDVSRDPITVTKQIAECRYILSSSLHGLIIADSLGVPNIHVVATNKLRGDGFKFDDYYSAYGIKHEFVDLNKQKITDLEYIKNNYKLKKEWIDEKKRKMVEAFPYKNFKIEKNR